ncbi:MAG: AgmX/PglI C-terminal domain-containing protein [Myxococcota bacterium]
MRALLLLVVVACVGCEKPDPFAKARLLTVLKGDTTLPFHVEPKLEVSVVNDSEVPLSFVRYEGYLDVSWSVSRRLSDGGIQPRKPEDGRLSKCGLRNPPDPEGDRRREEQHRLAARTVTLAPGATQALSFNKVTEAFVLDEGVWQIQASFDLEQPAEPSSPARKRTLTAEPFELTVVSAPEPPPQAPQDGLVANTEPSRLLALARSTEGTVSPAEPSRVGVGGSVDGEAVAATINAHLPELSSCYSRALQSQPGLGGQLVVEWTVRDDGATTGVKRRASSINAELEQCVLSTMKTWVFPPRGVFGSTLWYPLQFNLAPPKPAR